MVQKTHYHYTERYLFLGGKDVPPGAEENELQTKKNITHQAHPSEILITLSSEKWSRGGDFPGRKFYFRILLKTTVLAAVSSHPVQLKGFQ